MLLIMENVTELPGEWIVVPATIRTVGCCGPGLLHSLKINDWWLQIHEIKHAEPHGPYGIGEFPPERSIIDWAIIYKDALATSGVSNLSLTKTKIMLKIIFENIKDNPPSEERRYGMLMPS